MSLEQASLIAQIVSAGAVLVSLVYLGLQIRNNTRALRSQAYFNAASMAQRPTEMTIEDEGLTRVVLAGYAAPEALGDVDRERFENFAFMCFNGWEYLYYQHKDRSIPVNLWRGADAHYKSLVAAAPGLRQLWSKRRASYDEPFRSYVESQLAAAPTGVEASDSGSQG
jgi:hypothetical protein